MPEQKLAKMAFRVPCSCCSEISEESFRGAQDKFHERSLIIEKSGLRSVVN